MSDMSFIINETSSSKLMLQISVTNLFTSLLERFRFLIVASISIVDLNATPTMEVTRMPPLITKFSAYCECATLSRKRSIM